MDSPTLPGSCTCVAFDDCPCDATCLTPANEPGFCRDPDADGICACEPVIPCELTLAPVCGGACPLATQVCTEAPGGNVCQCVDIGLPCEQSAPVCNGECPSGTVCGAGAADECRCEPIDPCSCGDACVLQVAGTTLPGTCQNVAGANECECVADPVCPDGNAPFECRDQLGNLIAECCPPVNVPGGGTQCADGSPPLTVTCSGGAGDPDTMPCCLP